MGSSSRVGFLESLDSTVNTKVQEEAGGLLRGGAGDIQMGYSPHLNASHLNQGGNVTLAVLHFVALYIYLIFMLFLRIFLILLLTL